MGRFEQGAINTEDKRDGYMADWTCQMKLGWRMFSVHLRMFRVIVIRLYLYMSSSVPFSTYVTGK